MDHIRASHLDAMPHLMDISQSMPRPHPSQVKSEPNMMAHYSATSSHQMVPQMHPGYTSATSHQSPSPTSSGLDASAKIPTSSTSPSSSIQEADSNNSNSPNSQNGDGQQQGNMSKIPPKKRPLSVPDGMKDNAYFEKRKKNNESAKRSRDARRMKEEQIAMRVVYLEQENLQLRTEVSLLKSEIEKLRCMLYNS